MPTTKVVVAALVITGGWFTVSVKTCVATGVTPLLACTVNEKGEPTAVDGTPERTPAEESERPGGRVPADTEYVGVGEPVAVKVKLGTTMMAFSGVWYASTGVNLLGVCEGV